MNGYVRFLLPFLSGFAFLNPTFAQIPPPIDAGTGEHIVAATGPFTILQSGLQGILFAHEGGTIDASGGLTLTVTGINNTGLTAIGVDPTTGSPSQITASAITLSGPGGPPETPAPGVSTGAIADNGATITLSNSTLNVTHLGLAVGTETTVGHMDVTNTEIVLNGPTQNGPHIGAQILNADSTLTLHGGRYNRKLWMRR